MQTYFGYFGHVWLYITKIIVSTFRRLRCLSAYSGWQHLGTYLETQNFARYGVGFEISIKILVFALDYFQEKLMTKFLKKSKKPYFGVKKGWKIFLEKRLSVFKYSNYLPSSQKSEKTNMPFLRKILNWGMDGHTDLRTDRQTWFCRTLCRTEVQLSK